MVSGQYAVLFVIGFFVYIGLMILIAYMTSKIGMSGFTIASNTGAESVLANPDFTFAYMATTVFPPAIGLVCLIAGLSAIMSSADSDAIAGVTTFLTDVYALIFKKPVADEDIPKYSRIILVIMLVGAFGMTIIANDIMSYINNVIGSFTPGMAVALLVGRFWKRATWQGGVATMASGIVFGVIYLVYQPFNAWITEVFKGPALPVTIVTFIFCIVVSLLTPPLHAHRGRARRTGHGGTQSGKDRIGPLNKLSHGWFGKRTAHVSVFPRRSLLYGTVLFKRRLWRGNRPHRRGALSGYGRRSGQRG